VTLSSDPVWLLEAAKQERTLHVRVANSSQPYTGKDAEDYTLRQKK
jgi:hypothetical protein